MLAATRIVIHPDGTTISSYKYLPTSAHITLMVFIMKHVKSSDLQTNYKNKQNKFIISNASLMTRFIPNVTNDELPDLLEDYCNRTLTTKYNVLNDRYDFIETTAFISAFSYDKITKRVTIELCYRLIPFILYIKQQYIGERWKYSASFTSSYSSLVYDMIITNFDKNSNSIKFKLNDIKPLLGIENGTYEIYSNFKRKVLSTAVNEINAKTDLHVELIEHKTHRKVEEIQFNFCKK